MPKLCIFLIALFCASSVRVSTSFPFGGMDSFGMGGSIMSQIDQMMNNARTSTSMSSFGGSGFSSGSSMSSFSSGSSGSGIASSTVTGQDSNGMQYTRQVEERNDGNTLHRTEKTTYANGTTTELHWTKDLSDPNAKLVPADN